jgi:hypothetical protein
MMATLAERNSNEATVAPMLEFRRVCIWLDSGVRRSVSYCVFGRNLASVTVKIFFTFHLVYKFCISSVTCKETSARNCITVQHKRGSFLSTLTGQTTLAKT